MRSNRIVLIAFLTAAFASAVMAQSGGNYIIKDATLEGAAHEASGENFAVQARLGQGLAGPALTGGSFSVGGGFFPAPPAPVEPPTTPPAAPTDLLVVAVTRNRVDLAWQDNSLNEAGFAIERCNGNGRCTKWDLLATAGPGTTTFSDTAVQIGSVYQYRLLAFNEAGRSAYSNTVAAKTPRK